MEMPPRDTDGDGTPDYLDLDSDNDTIPDAVEGGSGDPCVAPTDSDGDGVPDFRDLDSDDPHDTSVPDAEEAGADPTHPVDTNQNSRPDYMDADNDGDGIPDLVELTPGGSTLPARRLADAPDSDKDGTPDFRDLDSDGDTVSDYAEGAVDTDGDGLPNFRDLDSDNDCLPDAVEVGNPNAPPVDTDGDMTPDFLDVDADNDGLVDGKEDANCNGAREACETDRKLADTDGDGVSDLVEVAGCAAKPPAQQKDCLCDGADAKSSPITHGDFVFVVDYQKPPAPTSETLALSTDLQKADVIFSIDTTGSMNKAIANLATSLQSVVSTVENRVKDIAFGLVQFRDFTALDPFVVKYDYRITSLHASNVADLQSKLSGLTTGNGGDYPEAGWEALYSIAGGPPLMVSANGGSWSSKFDLATTYPTTPPSGETQGDLGGAGFRAGSVPIVVTVSDAEWHDAPGTATSTSDPEAGLNNYSSQFNGVPTRATAVAQALAIGAHVMGIAGHGGKASGDAKARMLATATQTGAVAKPADFGPMGTRPAGCAADQCCTGDNGAGEAANATGQCPLSFSYDDTTGNGVGAAVASGIVALANSLKFDIHVEAKDVDPMTVNRFVDKLIPNVSGAGPAAMCVVIPAASLGDHYTGPQATPGADGVPDTLPNITNGTEVCFDVVPKMNTTVPNTEQPQLFQAQVQVKGTPAGSTAPVSLGTPREVFFLVPPMIKNGPIP